MYKLFRQGTKKKKKKNEKKEKKKTKLTVGGKDAAHGDGGEEAGAEQVETHGEPATGRQKEEPRLAVQVLVFVELAYERRLDAIGANRLQAVEAGAQVRVDGAASCTAGAKNKVAPGR